MAKWKYIREKEDSRTSTSLKSYLDFIFPDKEIIYDKMIPKDIVSSRKGSTFRRYRPDARCEELNLIIEVDGLPHYQFASAILSDIERDSYFQTLNYKMVRIPYWIQLSSKFIKYIFDIDVENICNLQYSFYDTPSDKLIEDNIGINYCIGSMCELGRSRFVSEFKKLTQELKHQVLQDILTCRYRAKDPELIAPYYIVEQLLQYCNNFKFDPDHHKYAEMLYR